MHLSRMILKFDKPVNKEVLLGCPLHFQTQITQLIKFCVDLKPLLHLILVLLVVMPFFSGY